MGVKGLRIGAREVWAAEFEGEVVMVVRSYLHQVC